MLFVLLILVQLFPITFQQKKPQKKSMSEDACKVNVRRKYKPNKNSMTNPGTKQEFIKSTGNETTFLLRASTPC